jgi:hypothetical protein
MLATPTIPNDIQHDIADAPHDSFSDPAAAAPDLDELRAIADGCAIRLIAHLQGVLEACSNLHDPKQVAASLRAASLLTRLCINIRSARAQRPGAVEGSVRAVRPRTPRGPVAAPQRVEREAAEDEAPIARFRAHDRDPRSVTHAAHRPTSVAAGIPRGHDPTPGPCAEDPRLRRPLTAAGLLGAAAGRAIGLRGAGP